MRKVLLCGFVAESTQLLFRSNTVATKSVEAYLKLYADKVSA